MSTHTFTLTEENYTIINEVRATLNIIASMGFSGTSDNCNDLSKNDLITVLVQLEQKLKLALDETTK